MHEEYRREQDEKAAKLERERRERLEKDNARRAYLAEGGTEEEFEKAWPEMHEQLAEARRRRSMNREQEARERQRESAVSRI